MFKERALPGEIPELTESRQKESNSFEVDSSQTYATLLSEDTSLAHDFFNKSGSVYQNHLLASCASLLRYSPHSRILFC